MLALQMQRQALEKQRLIYLVENKGLSAIWKL